MNRLHLSAAALLLGSLVPPAHSWEESLEHLLLSQPERFGVVMQDPARYRVQIIYTQIDRDENNRPTFRPFSYRLNTDEYFYPASTVKLPAAVLALEKINRLGVVGLSRDTAMVTNADREDQTAATEDETSLSGAPSVSHYIRKILLVSDNDAFNRLYEFLGQADFNLALKAKGLEHTRIVHRLSMPLSVEANRHTNPVRFLGDRGVLWQQGPNYNDNNLVPDTPILLGQAEVVEGKLLERPKNFAEKNAYALQDQHDFVQALMFPGSVDGKLQFELEEDDYSFLYTYMSRYPADSGIAAYRDTNTYPDGYVKFLMYGGTEELIPDQVRIFNKVGEAYGFLTDVAYVIDVEYGLEFLLAATIYTNSNATFNDGEYEYDEIGMPFLRDLGLAIYELELDRERAHRPDLSRFNVPP